MGNFSSRTDAKKKYEETPPVDKCQEKAKPDVDRKSNKLQENKKKPFTFLKAVDEKEKQKTKEKDNSKVCDSKLSSKQSSSRLPKPRQTSETISTKDNSFRKDEVIDYKDAYLKTQEHIEIAEQEVVRKRAALFQVKPSGKPEVTSIKPHTEKKKSIEVRPTTQKSTVKAIPYCKKDPFTKKAEEVVNNFFSGCDSFISAPPKSRSHLRRCPVLWEMHQRAQRLQIHSCKHKTVVIPKHENAKTDETPKKRNKWAQTDFPQDTWIHRKTTVGFGDNVMNVVSELSGEKLPCETSPEDMVRASNQLSLLRLSILKLLGSHGFAEQIKENLKKKCPEFDMNLSEHKEKLVALCREKVDLIANPFVENIGPLPVENERYHSILREFITIFRNSLDNEKANHPLREYIGTKAYSPLDSNKFMTPELEMVRSQIIREYREQKNGLQEQNKPSTAQSVSQNSEEQSATENNKDDKATLDDGQKNPSTDKIEDIENNEVEHDENAVGDVHRPTLLKIRESQLHGDKNAQNGNNPVGPFDRGTQYRTDGEIVVEKCKRGSRKNLLTKPTKIKTRGVPNKHLRQNPVPLHVKDFKGLELDNSKYHTESVKTDKSVTGAQNKRENLNSSNNGEIVDDFYEDFERALYAHLDSVMLNGEGSAEYTEDTRHLTNLPSQVIVGKKNDCDLLEEKYGPKNNKRRNKEDKKKRQRSKLMNTTLQFGLNVNNSADDPDMWSTDDEGEELEFSPVISFSERPLLEDGSEECLSPIIKYSTTRLADRDETCLV